MNDQVKHNFYYIGSCLPTTLIAWENALYTWNKRKSAWLIPVNFVNFELWSYKRIHLCCYFWRSRTLADRRKTKFFITILIFWTDLHIHNYLISHFIVGNLWFTNILTNKTFTMNKLSEVSIIDTMAIYQENDDHSVIYNKSILFIICNNRYLNNCLKWLLRPLWLWLSQYWNLPDWQVYVWDKRNSWLCLTFSWKLKTSYPLY